MFIGTKALPPSIITVNKADPDHWMGDMEHEHRVSTTSEKGIVEGPDTSEPKEEPCLLLSEEAGSSASS